MAVDVFSYAFFRLMLMKALVCFLLLIIADAGIADMLPSDSVQRSDTSRTVIGVTTVSSGQSIATSAIPMSAETISMHTQTLNQTSKFDKPELVLSSSVPIDFSVNSVVKESKKQFSSTKRTVRSIDSKLWTSQVLSNSESEISKKEIPSGSSIKNRNHLDTNEVDDVGKNAGEYYIQIQPTKTLSMDQYDQGKIIKTSTVDDGEKEISGEGYGAPRGRSLPLTEPETPMVSVDGTERMNVSQMTGEQTTVREIETPGLPANSFRSNYDDRKTSSDIQDIITGIVKLLNGNVKVQANPNLPPGGMMGAGRPLRPLSTRINNRGPPRITDVPPLPLDFDTTGPHPPRPPPLPPMLTSRPPPPYPFDRPPAIVPLPPQPSQLNHLGDHPFMTGVPLPEQIVPLVSTKRPQDNQGTTRPHRPRPSRPRPQNHSAVRRPQPVPILDAAPLKPQSRPGTNKKPSPEKISITLLEDHIQENHSSPPPSVTIQEEEEDNQNQEEVTFRPVPSSAEVSSVQPEQQDEEIHVTTEDMLNKPEEEEKEVIPDKVSSSLETSPSLEVPKIIATSSSSTVTEATEEVRPLSPESVNENTSIKLPVVLEPSVGIGVATPVLESSMQEILMHDITSSSDSDIHRTPTSSEIPTTSLSSVSSVIKETVSGGDSIASSSSKSQDMHQQSSSTGTDGGQSFPYHPYRPRPGIVLDDTEYKPGGMNRPIITAPPPGAGHAGDIFDVTVTAIQGPGGGNTGQPFIYPVEIEGVQLPGAGGSEVPVITKAEEGQHFVSIDGKRTYINLFGNTNEQGNIAPTHIQQGEHATQKQSSSVIGTGYAVADTVEHSSHSGAGQPTPPRRPYNRRPNHPPVRIDTCIVGDDSTCDSAQNEMCRTEVGVSSCHCRPGYSRRKHREPCRRVVSILMSLRVDRLYDRKVVWDGKLLDPESEEYKTLEWESSRAIDSAMSMTPFSDDFMGVRVNGLYTIPGGSELGGTKRGVVFVNLTLQLEESVETLRPAVRHDIQRHLLGVIHRRNNNVGHSALWVDSPPGSVSHLQDVDECSNRDLHDCHHQAHCSNIFGSFRCSCPEGYRDPWAGNPHRSGRQCETCSAEHCSSHGECRYEGGQPVCYCSSNFYGSQCEVDGEVLGVAVGASVAAVIIIVLTLVCLCMWSRRWSREQKTAAGMGSPVFGYMATGGSTVKTPAIGSPPYQVSLEDRLRWAQIADVMVQANHYAQPEPVPGPTRPSSAMFGYPSLTMSGTLPQGVVPPVPLPRLGLTNMNHTGAMSIHGGPALSTHGALSIHGGMSSHGMRTPERTVESTSSEEEDRADLLGRNFHVPRPRSRSSVANQSGIYYDVDYDQGEMYGSTSKNQHAAIPLSTYTMSSRAPYFRQ